MSQKSKSMPIIGAIVVIIIGLALAYWITRGTDTAPTIPPDRTNTEETLPAQPADPSPSPVQQQQSQ
ncbi:hypothetical protein [Rhizobium halophilum]|uniref:hypothetical protein n=1 Tax=Rhizobium halophilum TaxID=2846852 RepID=UPI001EFDB52F|nr:hypothetical protein [Rhizobium halophilum]MCF6370556.1 hypothetical protein [Rhizobium halophilum]